MASVSRSYFSSANLLDTAHIHVYNTDSNLESTSRSRPAPDYKFFSKEWLCFVICDAKIAISGSVTIHVCRVEVQFSRGRICEFSDMYFEVTL